MSDDAEPEQQIFVTDVVGDGPQTQAVVSKSRIKASDLAQEHVGKFLSCHDADSGVNYGAKILRIERRDEGKAPGVSIWLQHPALSSGRPARDGRAHVPFDQEFELIEMMAP
jgi:hypothetical protein